MLAWDKEAHVRNLRRQSGLNGHSMNAATIGIDQMLNTARHSCGSKCNKWKEPRVFSQRPKGD